MTTLAHEGQGHNAAIIWTYKTAPAIRVLTQHHIVAITQNMFLSSLLLRNSLEAVGNYVCEMNSSNAALAICNWANM